MIASRDFSYCQMYRHTVLLAAMEISEFCKRENMTQEQFAKRVGVSRGRLCGVALGSQIPSFQLIWRIYVATGKAVTPNDVFAPFARRNPQAFTEIISHGERLNSKAGPGATAR